jgi:transmembrane sensor
MLATPKGGQYQLVLPDGSKVWLNAASSIRYPVAFTGNERNVELTGEAYFEVAKNPAMPFKVIIPSSTKAGRSMIEVLGTHFNVSAYNDEDATKTTLLEGKVRIVSGEWAAGNGRSTGKKQEALLQPGQQALLFTSGQLKKIDDADVELAMAWKNGFTAFKSADIKSIMRQVARWYNVEVVYEGTIPQRSFTGGVSRDARLSELLHLLEVSKVNFRMEGNRLVVRA